VDVINSWRERGGRNEELRELPAEIDKLIRMGASPSAAGRSVATAAKQGRRPPGLLNQNGDRMNSRENAGPGSKPADSRDRGKGRRNN
jgi:hypothetical protein